MCHHSDCTCVCKDTPKPVPHKHAEVIKAWADGAKIEVLMVYGAWKDETNPSWSTVCSYRVKPEPKPDVVRYINFDLHMCDIFSSVSPMLSPSVKGSYSDHIKVVIDGETGKLKSVEIC